MEIITLFCFIVFHIILDNPLSLEGRGWVRVNFGNSLKSYPGGKQMAGL